MEGGDITAKVGDTITLPNCTKEDHKFIGWYDGDICIGKAGEQYTVSADVTLKAHYEKIENQAVICTVTFDADGGEIVRKSIDVEKGSTIILPACSKKGYEFLGWYAEKDGGILLGIPGSEMKAVKDMAAYALWEKEAEKDTENDADPETCKVTFHAGKGTIKVKEITIIKDGSLYLPMPEREGYDFVGWYLDDELTQFAGAYHDTYRITRDTSFYAKWEKQKENSGNNGGSGNSGNTGNGDNYNGDNTQDGDNSNETLNTYTIKYDANGGKTKNASVKVVKGGSVKLPGAEREDYIFKGWYTDRQVFIGTEGETYKPSRSISLYARWEKADKDNQNNNAESTSDKENKNTSDKNQNTRGTVSGNSAGSPSDKDTDTNTRTEGGNENAGNVCQIKCIVSQAFDYACDREIMSWNFMRKVKINEDRCKEHEDKELGVWEDDEINTLQSGSMNCWNRCRKYRNSPALFILCGTGLRLGELLALKWSKVDFERRIIKIERTQTEYTDYDTNSKIYEESTPKNKTSRRTIVINDFTYKWLMEQKRRTKQAGIESEYVIPANSGKMVKESNITNTFKAFCNNVGVEYKPSHTCRRSYVTNCLDKGMKLALVSKNVGHKNKSITLNTYYKCKNDYEDNLAIQNEIFKIYDFDFGGEQVEALFA